MAAQSVCAIGSAREPVLSVDIPRKGHERTFGTTFTVRNVPMCRVVYPGIPLSSCGAGAGDEHVGPEFLVSSDRQCARDHP